jgi:hypothetical protein
VETLELACEQSPWNLGKDPRSIAALAVGSDSATVAQIGDRLDSFGDNIVARLAAQPRDEADAAGIVFETRVV